eukprot:TRINITY_DN75916_c0_g1_i1.p1 TRINITY_DN75916_c0_g1~~TRINITY_DN75916_c0_g1_i1.p1  ORF type:complete len:407 (-),score=48.45 TRINITY_DN75916_c0_g1_i1:129-1349(-)
MICPWTKVAAAVAPLAAATISNRNSGSQNNSPALGARGVVRASESNFRPDMAGTKLPDGSRWGAFGGTASFHDNAGLFKKHEVEVLASGFRWTEGPTWLADQKALLFSDTIDARIYRWQDGRGVAILSTESGGYDGSNVQGFSDLFEPGSNGMALHGDRLCICQHPTHRVVSVKLRELELKAGRPFCDCEFKVLADSVKGRRLNSPNDVIVAPGGDVLFTDPIYGFLKKQSHNLGYAFLNAELGIGPDQPYLDERCRREGASFKGVYRLKPDTGNLDLLTSALERPNGLAFSPDGKLWVANSIQGAPSWHAFEVSNTFPWREVATITEADLGETFPGPGLADGFKFDSDGRIWTSTPGGIAVLDPHTKTVMAKVDFGTNISNIQFGDGGDVFVTGLGHVWRLERKV